MLKDHSEGQSETFMDEKFDHSSGGYKLVPWLGWEEWQSVRDSLFSNSPDSVSFAIRRINTWRSRGCLPVVIDVTSSIIEIQQMDPFFVDKNASHATIASEQMLAMLYCMAIIRLVNCVVEKTRKGSGISISEAADAIGIPRTLIDIRHEGSHRGLPALPLVRDASLKAIDWLKSYYWEPQSKQIPFQKDGISTIRKEIRSHLIHLFSSLKDKKQDCKRIKGTTHHEIVGGRSKLLSLMTSKKHSSKSYAQKKISRIVRRILQLYYSHSSEVVPVFLDFLLREMESSNAEDNHTLPYIWQTVVMKVAAKEPDMILTLLTNVISKMEVSENVNSSNEEKLPSLFSWLVEKLEVEHDARSTLQTKEIINKCFMIMLRGEIDILKPALSLAETINSDGGSLEKLKRLHLLKDAAHDSSLGSIDELYGRAKEAKRKLEATVAGCKGAEGEMSEKSGTWAVVNWWKPCPIGMLPHQIGSSGCLPDLSVDGDFVCDGSPKKRKGDSGLVCGVKKVKSLRMDDFEDINAPQSIEGCLIIGGLWKKVDDEFGSVQSRLGILV